MLKRHSQVFLSLLFAGDLVSTVGCWIGAYALRFHLLSGLLPVTKGIPDFVEYARMSGAVVVAAAVVYRLGGLYQPRREGALFGEFTDILKANALLFIVLLAGTAFYREYEYSRGVFAVFLALNTAVLAAGRVVLRSILRAARRRGCNVRYALIVGSGKLAQYTANMLRRNSWLGIRLHAFVDDRPERIGRAWSGVPIVGPLERLPSILREKEIDQVFVALPARDVERSERIVAMLAEETVDVRIVPDFYHLATLNYSVTELDGLVMINLRESPVYGWNRAVKRGIDVAFSLCFLTVASLVMIPIAILIKLTSPGPVFYRQERMGLDGVTFQMLKFRTMRMDAEAQTGPVWAKESDPRRTGFGAFLRRTSLDELPQFFNVLKGEMSVVGPRPERPVFIEQFKKTIPRYMLRHKMKAGITGWAQVNGWRGNTSLRKRIQYDLYYIENWSVLFDLRIMLLTAFRGLINPNAY
ncbi:MAG: undecaprenyl-phosphate glucose phosphotransferase [Planctomycetes bacterium]|nr:undecaprenyl-phosphate glucose phosphotransferase [Planctomycetota bacterium]